MLTWFNTRAVHVELSSKCTLKCPRCPRTELDQDSLNREFSLAEFEQAFPLADLAHTERLIFCGDLGDPIYATEFLDICKYIKQTDCRLVIVTNGSYRKQSWWRELGTILTAQDQVTFSVDGWDQQSNEQYRVNCDFASIVSGIQTLRQNSSCLIVWSAIYFAFNEDRMINIQSLAQSLGVDCFQTVRSSKFGGRYSVNGLDPLQPRQVAATAQYEKSLQSFTGRMPITANYSNSAHAWARCLRHEKELLITATGLVLPCPWFNSGYQPNSFVSQHSERLNVKTRSLNTILADTVWQELWDSFDTEPLPICKIKCKDCK